MKKQSASSALAARAPQKRERTGSAITDADDDPLDREIDFSNARRNPFARDYAKFRNVMVIAPDVLKVFPDAESVNEALRTLIRLTAPMPRRKISARRVAAKKERG
jgi:hypothetical protein